MLIVYDPEDTHALHEPLTDVAMGLPSVYDDVPLRLHRVFDELKRIYGKPGIPKSGDKEGKDGTFMPYRDFGREPLLRVHDHAFIEYLERIWEQWVARGGNRETGVQVGRGRGDGLRGYL